MDADRRWTLAIFLFSFADGIGMQMRGALLPSLQGTFGVPESLLGLVAPAGTLGFVLVALLVGFVGGRLDVRRALLVGALGVFASMLLMSGAVTYLFFLVFLLGRGMSTGVFKALDRPLLGHIYSGSRGRIFNLYALAWAVGATTGPLFVNLALAAGDWRLTYLALAFVFVPTAVVIWRLELPASSRDERPLTLTALRELLTRPVILGVSAALLLSGSVEGGIFIWLPYYANHLFSRSTANLVLTVFLAAYVPGRYVYSRLSEHVGPLDTVLVLSAVAVPLLYLTFTVGGGYAMLASTFAAGFLVSGLFPTLSAFGVDSAAEYSGPINGLVVAASYLGSSIMPVVIGLVASGADIGLAMQLLVAVMAGLVLVTLTTRRRLAVA